MPSASNVRLLLRYRVEFEPGDDPGSAVFVFQTPDGPVRVRPEDAVGPLSEGIRAMNADATVRAWARPAIIAQRLLASGRLTEPTGGDLRQLQTSGAEVDRDPHRAHFLVTRFVAALEQTKPAPPQRHRPASRTRHRKVTYSYVFTVTIDDAPDDGFMASVGVRIRNNDRGWAPVDIADLWGDEHHFLGQHARDAVTDMLDHLRPVWPPAGRLLERVDAGSVRVTSRELVELGQGHLVSHLLAHRIDVQWPQQLHQPLSARAVVREHDSPDPNGFFSDGRLFGFDWRIAVGDTTLTSAELDELAETSHGLLKVRDRWVLVDPERVHQILERPGGTLSPADALRAAVTGTAHIHGDDVPVDTAGFLDDVRRRLAARPHNLADIGQPHTLAGTLRSYQRDGMRWLAHLSELGLGGCLADDMGLGKTIMIIALHLTLADDPGTQPTLVVCPASVIGNWEREITRFAPSAPVYRHHGPDRYLDDVKDGFVLTTYATMRKDAPALAEHQWGLIVADEAQQVKNPSSAAARALRTIDGRHRFALTGTPIENALSELWAILDWTTPGLLGSRRQFQQRYIRPIENGQDRDRADELSRLIRPFVLRRRKSDPQIAPELPPKTVTDHPVSLTREQIGLYQATVRDTMKKIQQSDGLQRRGLVIKLLTALKQICNHPAHFLRQYDQSLAGRSGKLDVFDGIVDEIVSENAAVLVFTQYAQMGKMLERHIRQRGVPVMFLSGATGVQQRDEMVGRFQRKEVPVFVLSLRAAGVGLNLTAADHVIHYDRWWNPAVEDQATDRAHRIGQTKPVQVHRLSAEGTVEESIAELMASKRDLADSVINAAESTVTELTDSELAGLVRLRR